MKYVGGLRVNEPPYYEYICMFVRVYMCVCVYLELLTNRVTCKFDLFDGQNPFPCFDRDNFVLFSLFVHPSMFLPISPRYFLMSLCCCKDTG